ncbi:hydrogenase maturation factor HoxX [Methyloglobulus morosus KoM1]|uniref:Hydrogenase maturation factor HoxX n=1 Tax=Methyloglobulus morosus KoM1 TaxID=1116472 RepID=V5E0R9_9GAMM|nr:hydrogenase maturation protein [Methyloglobulus morosus]ESS73146.1 hydrogenase maturation factor HoxX [Methyloglobulus morosus KoM1]
MKILLLSSAYNGMTQRVHVELLQRGHTVSIEVAINEHTMLEGVQLFQPDIIICPFLRHRIPENIWRHTVCIVVHPGIKGDRGASSLDWAIQNKEAEWGVTALQAAEEIDAGDIWAMATFKMRPGTKSGIYTVEVIEAAVKVVLQTLERFQDASFKPEPLDYSKPDVRGQLRPTMQQAERRIDWKVDTTDTILDKINAADGCPGVLDNIFGTEYYLYGATKEDKLGEGGLLGQPGELIAKRLGAVCRATVDGAIWISHLKPKGINGEKAYFKLPAVQILGDKSDALPEIPISMYHSPVNTFREIWYEEKNAVGYLHFEFHNGAMSTDQCRRLRDAVMEVRNRPTQVLVLMGGRSTWSNGVHLNVIEAADNPAEESWHNINAIDDLIYAILTTTNKITVAAVHGNAGAGGVPLALACDKVCVRSGVVFNMHYKLMGLYGSEYWTYTLPRRVGYDKALDITEACMPIGMQEAKQIGLVDFIIPELFTAFDHKVEMMVESLVQSNNYDKILESKEKRRSHDEFIKPLKYYRQEELRHMREDFYKPNSPYHPSRKQFVYKTPATETPERLALHRRSTRLDDKVLSMRENTGNKAVSIKQVN